MTSTECGKEYFKMLKSAFELETCSYNCELWIKGTHGARLQRFPYITVLDRLGEGEMLEKYTHST
jgi:hypothetical protein